MTSPVAITAFYAFYSLDEQRRAELKALLTTFGREHGMRGLVLVAPEGINGTVSANVKIMPIWKELLEREVGSMTFKDSSADKEVFRRWSVKMKSEIVAIKDDKIHPNGKHNHISPEEWQRMLKEEDVLVLDTRNTYETAIGMFKTAIDPKIDEFSQFPEFVRNSGIPKDKKVLMYCTGGIRCEKALLAMEAQGYNNVYQLDGGILAYLQKFPNADFEGECFVFDHRVAVDQQLQPSKQYGLCPHCGDPGSMPMQCCCGKTCRVCSSCSKDETQHTCSKRCRNELREKLTYV